MPTVYYTGPARLGRISAWFAWTLAILLLLSTGIVYRVLASRLKLTIEAPINLPTPLSAIPTQIGSWTGKDVPIPQNIQRVAGNDDFLNRLYINQSNKQWANVYIAYTARPKTMLGHRPQVCYVGGGWIHDNTEPAEVVSNTGRKIPCLIHRFHMPSPSNEERVVLNFYIVNGQITADESVFTGLGWRTPNIAGNPARYVAQIQVSSVLENSVQRATRDMTDLILDFFPDDNNKTNAVEYENTISGVLE